MSRTSFNPHNLFVALFDTCNEPAYYSGFFDSNSVFKCQERYDLIKFSNGKTTFLVYHNWFIFPKFLTLVDGF